MNSPRLRLWMLMAIVAAIGLAIGGWKLYLRRVAFLSRAVEYARKEERNLSLAESMRWTTHVNRKQGYARATATWERRSARYAKRADYFTAMRRKYEHAARNPWLTVPPDSPEPE